MELPKEIKTLHDDLVFAFYELDEYSQIFRESEARIDLLNKVAPNFFAKLNYLFGISFIMTISRFTDPEHQLNYENISLEVLQKYQTDLNEVDQKTLTEKLSTIKAEEKQVRKFRNKYLIHRDRVYALGKNDIGSIALNKIENIYNLISDCLNIFNWHYTKQTVMYRGMRTNPGARSLLFYIKEGVIYSELKARRKNSRLNEEERQLSKFKDG